MDASGCWTRLLDVELRGRISTRSAFSQLPRLLAEHFAVYEHHTPAMVDLEAHDGQLACNHSMVRISSLRV